MSPDRTKDEETYDNHITKINLKNKKLKSVLKDTEINIKKLNITQSNSKNEMSVNSPWNYKEPNCDKIRAYKSAR